MSEDSVKIVGVVQVGVYLIIGAIYITILYFVATSVRTGLLDNSIIVSLTSSTIETLRQYDRNSAMIMVAAGIIFLSVITGMLLSDMIRKFTVVSPFLLFIISAVDLIPVKLITDGL